MLLLDFQVNGFTPLVVAIPFVNGKGMIVVVISRHLVAKLMPRCCSVTLQFHMILKPEKLLFSFG